jgi:group I intron endonuclease
MKPSNRIELSNKILDTPNERYCEIYKITNISNNKSYIGQAVSHILNHKKYRPYGREGRFRCHISEAFSNKKNQSHYLNNAIRKFGVDSFIVELLECCEIKDADYRETYYINALQTLFPYGYNLKNGGSTFTHSDESKKRVSDGVFKYYENTKYEKFKNVTHIDNDIEKYIKPLKKYGEQYGWYVYIDRKKADFGGIHISLEDSKQNALNFINTLKERINMQRIQTAGNSLELSLPLTSGNICEELG